MHVDQKGKRKMWERDLKQFADEYNFVSLVFNNEAVESAVADDVTTAKVRAYVHTCIRTYICTNTYTLTYMIDRLIYLFTD